jgi:carboxypeptidase Q
MGAGRISTRRRVAAVAASLALIGVLAAAGQQPDVDVLQRIKREATRSQAGAIFDHLTTAIGPRLTGSPAHKAAAEWSKARLTEWGLTDPRLDAFEFGRGWELDRLVVEMIEPRYMPLIGYAEAWSPSTKGEIVAAPVLAYGRSADELAAMADRLRGAIVMTQPETTFIREDRLQPTASDAPVPIGQPPFPAPRVSQQDARRLAALVREAGAGAVLRTSSGEHGTVFVLGRDQADAGVPTIVLAGEHYNMIARMLRQNVPVRLRVDLRARFLTTDTSSYNVLAELPGTDPAARGEVVMLGAHLDSWHTAPGATDNADGAAAALEAMRILKAIDARPRRTIRLALWSGEEQGLLGSRAYAQRYLAGDANRAERDRHVLYLNVDPGSGPIYGWYSENSSSARAVFDRWLEPLRDLGMRRNVAPGIGNTDHLSFRAVGVPGFNPVQDYAGYDVRTHHTNMDTPERVHHDDLRQNAIVLAWFIYQAASTRESFDRVPPK